MYLVSSFYLPSIMHSWRGILEEKPSVFHHWVWCLLWVFHMWLLLCWGNYLPFLVFEWVMKECWILSNSFSASIKIIMWLFSPFILLMWHTTLINFSMLKHPYKNESYLIMYITLLIGWWFLYLIIWWEFLH